MIKVELNDQEQKRIPEEYKELAIVRKLQLMISPYLKRNSRFFLEGANVPEKSRAYNAPISQEAFEESMKKGEVTAVVCRNLCILATQILADNGVKAEVITCDTDIFRHADLLITSKTGKQYIVNILEDLDLIQAFMKTPNFASEEYYKLRYQKFEANNGITTNENRIENIAFITPGDLLDIDRELGYLKSNNGMYMNDVLAFIKKKITDFRAALVRSEFLKNEARIEREYTNKTPEEIERIKREYIEKLQLIVASMSEEEIISKKIDWIFTFCNDRMNIKGHTDFVMYYSQSLLKGVLEKDEYKALTRFDGFTYEEQLPEDSRLREVLDFENPDYDGKLRFSVVQCGNDNYIISTKPNSYIKISTEELEVLRQYCVINVSEPPSELAINLSFKGHALPLIFHKIGGRLINEKQASLGIEGLDDEQRKAIIEEVAQSIETTDEPITSIVIPYETGAQRIYLDDNNDFVVEQNGETTIYYYDTRTDTFTTKTIDIGDEEHGGGR